MLVLHVLVIFCYNALPLIFSIEKDPYDTSQKAKESQDTSHKIIELQKKLDSARSQVRVA
jgi:mediator of RNA polymerase II transcription subunit 9